MLRTTTMPKDSPKRKSLLESLHMVEDGRYPILLILEWVLLLHRLPLPSNTLRQLESELTTKSVNSLLQGARELSTPKLVFPMLSREINGSATRMLNLLREKQIGSRTMGSEEDSSGPSTLTTSTDNVPTLEEQSTRSSGR